MAMMPAYGIGEAAVAFVAVCVALLAGLLAFSWAVRPIARRPAAEQTYECGMPAKGERRHIGFGFIGYAALFLVFDLAALYVFLLALAPGGRAGADTLAAALLGTITLCVILVHGMRRRRYYVA